MHSFWDKLWTVEELITVQQHANHFQPKIMYKALRSLSLSLSTFSCEFMTAWLSLSVAFSPVSETDIAPENLNNSFYLHCFCGQFYLVKQILCQNYIAYFVHLSDQDRI